MDCPESHGVFAVVPRLSRVDSQASSVHPAGSVAGFMRRVMIMVELVCVQRGASSQA